MAILKIRAIDGIPPEQLGDVHVVVTIGSTVAITQGMLMGSNPPYFHEYNRPLGSVKIVGYGQNVNNLTRPTSGNGLIANIVNNGNIIRYTSGTNSFTNSPIPRAMIEATNFRVTGYAVGSDYISFISTSINSDNITESEYSEDVGKIYIHVISSTVTNTKPSQVGGNQVDCYIGGSIIMSPEMFTSETTPPYADAQNDPPLSVNVTSVPNVGIFTFNGIPVTPNQIVLISDIALGKLKFSFNSDVSLNYIDQFNFGVSDTGTGQFTY